MLPPTTVEELIKIIREKCEEIKRKGEDFRTSKEIRRLAAKLAWFLIKFYGYPIRKAYKVAWKNIKVLCRWKKK